MYSIDLELQPMGMTALPTLETLEERQLERERDRERRRRRRRRYCDFTLSDDTVERIHALTSCCRCGWCVALALVVALAVILVVVVSKGKIE